MNSPPTSGAPPPGAYLKAIRHHRRAIAALVLAAVVAGAAFSLWAGKRYDAEAVLSVSPLPSDDPALVSVGVFREAGSGAATSVYALSRLITTPAVVEGVKERLAMPDATRESVLQDVEGQDPLSRARPYRWLRRRRRRRHAGRAESPTHL